MHCNMHCAACNAVSISPPLYPASAKHLYDATDLKGHTNREKSTLLCSFALSFGTLSCGNCMHDQVNASDTIHTWCFCSAPGEHMLCPCESVRLRPSQACTHLMARAVVLDCPGPADMTFLRCLLCGNDRKYFTVMCTDCCRHDMSVSTPLTCCITHK